MPDVTAANAASERSRAQFRADLAEVGYRYAAQVAATAEAEKRWAQDPDRDDLAEQAKASRGELDEARAEFDRLRAAAAGRHTKRVNALVAEL